jgi:hypothetical protein
MGFPKKIVFPTVTGEKIAQRRYKAKGDSKVSASLSSNMQRFGRAYLPVYFLLVEVRDGEFVV